MKEEHPLCRVAVKILEDWAMMLVDPADPTTILAEMTESPLSSDVDIRGTVNGCIQIIAPQSFLEVLARNLLGDDATPPEALLKDSFREMGNVLAGNFLTEAFHDECVFELLEPRVRHLDAESIVNRPPSRAEFAFLADDEPVVIRWLNKE